MNALAQRVASLGAAGRFRAGDRPGLGEVILARLAEEPDRILVTEGDQRLTRGEAVDMALRLGAGLQERGLAPGSVIAFQLPNWWEACVLHTAAVLFGYPLVPLLTIYRAAELEVMLSACGVDAIFLPERHRDTDFPALVAGLRNPPRHRFVLRGNERGAQSFERLLASAPSTPAPARGDEAKVVIFTSGSTGRPKGVIHTHATLDAVIRNTAEHWSIDARDALYVPSPIGHSGGSLYAFEFPWITGCSAILEPQWDADLAVSKIETGGASFMAGATPFLNGLVTAAERAGTALPGLRRFICGGASVPPELIRRALRAFPETVVSRAYGSTEVPLACPGVRNRADAEAHADTDGEIAVELRLQSASGDAAAPGETGEILVRAPFMSPGYLDPADDTGSFTEDGYFRMGDLGRIVDGRFIVITGRVKDLIIRKGENISPLEIENALLRHPAIAQVGVVGTPDPERGEMVVAFVATAPGAAFDMAEMTAHLAAQGLARQKFPERLVRLDAMPMSAVGKVQKQELRAMAAALPGREDRR